MESVVTRKILLYYINLPTQTFLEWHIMRVTFFVRFYTVEHPWGIKDLLSSVSSQFFTILTFASHFVYKCNLAINNNNNNNLFEQVALMGFACCYRK